MPMKLSENVGLPVAYVDIEESRTEGDSVRQEVIDISGIGFVPKELIFDVAEDGKILGVEIL
jgi:uncharacterized protein YuzE